MRLSRPYARITCCSRSHLQPIPLAADPTYWTAIALALTPSGSPHSSVRYRLVVAMGYVAVVCCGGAVRAGSLTQVWHVLLLDVRRHDGAQSMATRTPRSALSVWQPCSLRTRRRVLATKWLAGVATVQSIKPYLLAAIENKQQFLVRWPQCCSRVQAECSRTRCEESTEIGAGTRLERRQRSLLRRNLLRPQGAFRHSCLHETRA